MVTLSLHGGLKIDGALQKPVMNFIQKLSADPTNPSLKIKTLNNSVDKRVRTGRVNDQFRAILFEIKDASTHHFVLVDVDSHDEGNAKAQRLDPATLRLEVNPINGITSLVQETQPVNQPSDQSDSKSDSKSKAQAAAKAAQELAAEQAREATETTADLDTDVDVQIVEKRAPAPRTELERHGYTPEQIYSELGVDTELTRAVYELDSEAELDALLASRPKWEQEALYSLVAGYTIEETASSLGLHKTTESDSAASEEARLLQGMRSGAGSMDFAYIDDVDTDSLRAVIEAGSFQQWRVYIHPEQRRMAEGSYNGSARVFGGAGTGKTVVAVHRANNLAQGAVKGQTVGAELPRVLLTTFTKGLSEGLRSQMNALNPSFTEATALYEPGLLVDNIDAVVRKVVDSASAADIEDATQRVLGTPSTKARPYTDRAADDVWNAAIEVADESLPGTIANETFLKKEYEAVVLAKGITTQADYLKVARTGRGTPLNRKQRKAVWAVLESVMHTQAIDGRMFWPTMSAVGAAVLDVQAERGEDPLFNHVVIDEAQDFNAGHWRFLRASVPSGPNDIFLAEDAHQRIYGQQLTLSHFGIETRGGASRRLTLNYRTTKENLEYALRILDGTEINDLDEGVLPLIEYIDSAGEVDSIFGYRSARSGPQPSILRASSPEQEIIAAAGVIRRWLDHGLDVGEDVRVGVMCRTRGQFKTILSGLADDGIDAVQTKNADSSAQEQVSVMTMHGAKGMEFTHVVLIGVDKAIMPQRYALKNLSAEDQSTALQRERSLLYVAASRARDELVITTSNEPSELLPPP